MHAIMVTFLANNITKRVKTAKAQFPNGCFMGHQYSHLLMRSDIPSITPYFWNNPLLRMLLHGFPIQLLQQQITGQLNLKYPAHKM